MTSAPYTPITGERLWLAKGESLSAEIVQTAIAGVDDIAQQVGASGWHGLFVTPELAKLATVETSAIPSADEIDNIIQGQNAESDNASKYTNA